MKDERKSDSRSQMQRAGNRAGRFVGDMWKRAVRLVVIVFGITLLLFGVVLIFIPGPAIVVIPMALAILSTEFVWARRFLNRMKRWRPKARS